LNIAEICNVIIHNCIFTLAKNDGLDSDSAMGGIVSVFNSYFEFYFQHAPELQELKKLN